MRGIDGGSVGESRRVSIRFDRRGGCDGSRGGEAPGEVRDQVGDVLDTDGETDEARPDPPSRSCSSVRKACEVVPGG